MYFAAVALLITIVGRFLYRRRRYDGQIAVLSLALFSLSTLVLDGFREAIPGQAHSGALRQLVWMAIALSVRSVALLGACEVSGHRRRALE